MGAIRRGERKQDPSSHLNTGTILSKGLTQGSEKKKKKWQAHTLAKDTGGFWDFPDYALENRRKRGRKQRKPSELESDCYYFHTAWWVGGSKEGEEGGEKREKPNKGCCCGGPVVSCPPPTPPLALLLFSLYTYTSSCQRMGGRENSPFLTKLCQNGSGKNKTCRHTNGGEKWSGFWPKYDKTPINLKEGEGCSGEASSCGSIQ